MSFNVDGVYVQAFLSIPEYVDARRERGEIWQVRMGDNLLELGLPRRIIDFAPILLRSEIAERFSTPDALLLCPEKTTACKGESVGAAFVAAERHDGPWSYVSVPNGPSGWIYLPELGEAPNEIAIFTGGLVAYFRKDFEQADRLFERVLTIQAARSPVRMDALLLRAASLSRIGRTADADVVLRKASEFNPYSRYVLQVRTMNAIAKAKNLQGKAARTFLSPFAKELNANRRLFVDGDPWLISVERLFVYLGLSVVAPEAQSGWSYIR